MSRMTFRMRWILAAIGVFVLTGCPSGRVSTEGLEPLPELDLSTVESVARDQLEDKQNALDRLQRRAREPRELADGFGDLGELYHAYQMPDAAAVCYRNAAQLDPASFLWPYLLGVVDHQRGSFDTATQAFERAREIRPDNAPVQLRLAEVFLAQGRKEEAAALLAPLGEDERYAATVAFGLGRASEDPAAAVAYFERALELDPAASAVRHPLGLALRRLGRLDEARQALEAEGAVPVAFPDPPVDRIGTLAIGVGAHLRRGNQALMRQEFDLAIGAYRQAIAAQPSHIEAQRNLALALSRDGQLDKAVQALEQAIEKQVDNVWLHYDLGNLHMQQGRPGAAIASLEKAVELAPDLGPALFNLGSALVGSGRYDQARGVLERLVEVDGSNVQGRYLLAVARGESGERPQAIETLRRLIDENPGETGFARSLVKLLADANRVDEATAVYEQALARDLTPELEAELLGGLAELEWRRGRKGKAIEAYREAADLLPESSQVHTQLANVLQLSGRQREAAETFARAVELDPQNATAWLSEGTLWILLGDHLQARERFEAALAVHPEDVGLVHTLARLLATSSDPAARDGQRALRLANQALSLENTPQHAETVAMAMAELGRFEKAIEWQRSLMAQAAQMGDQNLLRQMAIHLRYYQERKPIRTGP